MEAYCFRCRSKQEMKSPRQITLDNGRPFIRGICPVCGTTMFKAGSTQRELSSQKREVIVAK